MDTAHKGVPWHGLPPDVRLRNWLQPDKSDLWIVFVYSAAIGLLSLVIPVATQSLVNTIAFGMLMTPLVVLALVVLAALGFSSVLRGIRTWVVEVIQRRIFVRAASEATGRLVGVRIDAYDRSHGPELVNRFFDIVTVQKGGAILLVDGLAILMQTVVGLFLLAVYHPLLLAFGTVIVASIAVILIPLGRGAVATSVKESKAKYALAAWLQDLARYPVTFKSPHGKALAIERANALVEQYLHYRSDHFRVLFRQIKGALVLETLASAVLLAAGAWLVMNQRLTLGQLVASELILTAVVSGFSKFGKQLETYYDILAAVDKLGYITDLPLEAGGRDRIKASGPANVQLAGIGYTYASGRKVLSQLDWNIPAGARLGLSCAIGSGKSTLLEIVGGLRTPTDGFIGIQGQDYRTLNLDELRSTVVLLREAEIFRGTIAENLRMGDKHATAADMDEALKKVGLSDAVRRLSDGLETQLETGGQPLSSSAVVRLVIARAMLMKPTLLLIDESLDPILDSESWPDIRACLFDREAPWTLVVATGNPEVLAACDRTYTLRDNQLVEVTR